MKPTMLNRQKTERGSNAGGFALAVVLLMLAVMLLLGTTLVQVSVSENQAGSTVADMKKAFSAAEIGLREAMYRMRLDPATLSDEGETAYTAAADPVVIGKQGTPDTSWADPTSPNSWHYNPSWAYSGSNAAGYGNYFGGNAANLDGAGRTFTSSGGTHAAGGALVNANLTNTAADPQTYTVTVAPVVGFVEGCWQYVDQRGAPLGSCTSVATNPMFKVTSTGTAKSARKTLTDMIQRYNINPKLDGALTANSGVSIQSAAATFDGHNFDCNGNHASDTDSVKAVTVPSGASLTINKAQNLECAAGTGIANCSGTSSPLPSTLAAYLLGPNATSGDITALNEYLDSIKVAPSSAPTSVFHGVVYIDGDYTQPPDGSTGVLIVHNATSTATLGNFNGGTFKGLIIADQLQMNGTAHVIGGITTFGSVASGEGNPSVKYSSCIVAGLSQNFPFQVVRGTWHQLQL